MKQVLFSGKGEVEVCEVPVPGVLPRSVLVATAFSLISTGTEGAALSGGGGLLGVVQSVRQKPERLKQAWRLAQTVGVHQALGFIQQKLAEYSAPGYSAVGRVIDVSDPSLPVKVGDLVACVGAGIAVHAEYLVVPENLLVVLPPNVAAREASFGALLCIAMQGIRRLQLDPGEIVGVIGLGLIGQITLQLLSAMGYRSIGFDLRGDRAAKARELGFSQAWSLTEADPVQLAAGLTHGHGLDGVIVSAATSSDAPVNLAFDLCRRGGRVSLVGDVGLQLERSRMYRKEIELRMSCSYGPGRYDDEYELGGKDYPYSYVRWTERRNLEYALSLIASGKLNLAPLISHSFSIREASAAYSVVKAAAADTYGVVFEYDSATNATFLIERKVTVRGVTSTGAARRDGLVRIAVIGTGSFCKSVHLPNLAKLRDLFAVTALSSRTGTSAMSPAKRYGIPLVTSDYREILGDASVEAVLISTRHSGHAKIVLEALSGGKHVFVEKPMCLTEAEGAAIVDRAAAAQRIVQVGFNRRYAPMLGLMREALGKGGPRTLSCRVNVGAIGDAWSNAASEGGRLLGEGVHFFDLCNWFMGSQPDAVSASAIGEQDVGNPNAAVIMRYPDGSTAQVLYTTLGHAGAGKEYFEAFGNGRTVSCEDYAQLRVHGASVAVPRSARRNKGLLLQLQGFAAAIRGQPFPVERPDEYAGLRATRIALQVSALAKTLPA